MDFFNTIYNIFYLFLWNIQIVRLGFILIRLNNFLISVAFLNFLLDRVIFYVYYITCVREKFRSMNIIYARVAQWWSTSLPRRGSRVRSPSRALLFCKEVSIYLASFLLVLNFLWRQTFLSYLSAPSQISCPCSKLPLIHLL